MFVKKYLAVGVGFEPTGLSPNGLANRPNKPDSGTLPLYGGGERI